MTLELTIWMLVVVPSWWQPGVVPQIPKELHCGSLTNQCQRDRDLTLLVASLHECAGTVKGLGTQGKVSLFSPHRTLEEREMKTQSCRLGFRLEWSGWWCSEYVAKVGSRQPPRAHSHTSPILTSGHHVGSWESDPVEAFAPGKGNSTFFKKKKSPASLFLATPCSLWGPSTTVRDWTRGHGSESAES